MGNHTITPRQISRIEIDAARAGFSDPQDAVNSTPGVDRSRNWRYDLNSTQASAVIDALAEGLVADPTPSGPTVTVEGGVPAADALALLGKRVRLSVAGSDVVHVGRVVSISASSKDGTPAFDVITDAGRTRQPRLSIIGSWAVL